MEFMWSRMVDDEQINEQTKTKLIKIEFCINKSFSIVWTIAKILKKKKN